VGSAAFLQTLSFPGGYAPVESGERYNTPAWFSSVAHNICLKYPRLCALEGQNDTSVRSTTANITITLACVFGQWPHNVAGDNQGRYLPSFYTTSVTLRAGWAIKSTSPCCFWEPDASVSLSEAARC